MTLFGSPDGRVRPTDFCECTAAASLFLYVCPFESLTHLRCWLPSVLLFFLEPLVGLAAVVPNKTEN